LWEQPPQGWLDCSRRSREARFLAHLPTRERTKLYPVLLNREKMENGEVRKCKRVPYVNRWGGRRQH